MAIAPQQDWFAQNLPPGLAQNAVPTYQPGPNQTMPVGQPQPVGNDLRTMQPQGGQQQLTPDEVLGFLSQYGTDYDSVRAADAAGRQKYGSAWPQLLEHATKLDKWQFPNGQVYDLVNSSGSPAASWVTRAMPEAPGGHAMGGGGTLASLGGGGGIPGLNPMTDFMLDRARQSMERGAAARGTIFTGGFQRRLGEELQNSALMNAWQPAFGNNLSLATLGLNATNMANQSGTSYGNNLQGNINNQSDLLTNQSNAGAGATLAQGQNDANANLGIGNTLGNIAENAGNLWALNRQNQQPGQNTSIPTTPGTWGPWQRPNTPIAWQGPPLPTGYDPATGMITDNWGGPSSLAPWPEGWQGPPAQPTYPREYDRYRPAGR